MVVTSVKQQERVVQVVEFHGFQSLTIVTTRSTINQYRDGPLVTLLQEHMMKLNDSLRKAQTILIDIGTALWWQY